MRFLGWEDGVVLGISSRVGYWIVSEEGIVVGEEFLRGLDGWYGALTCLD